MALKKATIVLEGGATRGIFTSGALDYLMFPDSRDVQETV